MSLTKGLAGAYQNYQNGQSLGDIATNFASGMSGSIGATWYVRLKVTTEML